MSQRPWVVFAWVGVSAIAAAQSRFERISVSSSGAEQNGNLTGNDVVISTDGRHIAFDSYANNLAPYDLNNTVDVFVHDRVAGTTVLISTALTGLAGNNASFVNAISADGRFVVFSSSAYDLVKYDTNGQRDVFVRDRDPGADGVFDEGDEITTRVSVDSAGVEGDSDSFYGSISDDGSLVAFGSNASNLVSGDTNNSYDVFVRDLVAGTTKRVSVSSLGGQANGGSQDPQISSDGSIVAFVSSATNLVARDLNGRQDAFVHDRVTKKTTRVSVKSDGTESNGDAMDVTMSGDGQLVAFWTYADNLVNGDTNGSSDVFLHDRSTATTTRLSVSETGAEGDRNSYYPHVAHGGQLVLFGSAATNLAGVETNNAGDVFIADLASGELRKVSVHPSGKEGAGGSFDYAISDDGVIVALVESSFDLIGSDANGVVDLIVRNFAIPDLEASWASYGAGWPGTLGIPSLTPSADPVMGTTIDVQIGNSLGFYTVGFLLIGVSETSVVTKLGGTLLVNPLFSEALLVGTYGTTISGDLPLDDALVGVSLFLQVLETDANASDGVSFTPGLELTLGQ